MASEETTSAREIDGEVLAGIPPALHLEADPYPSPELNPIDHPNGDGILLPIQNETDSWRIEHHKGPRDVRARHRFTSLKAFVEWMQRWTAIDMGAQVLAHLPYDFKADDVVACVTGRVDPRDPGGDLVLCDLVFDPTFWAWLEPVRSGQRLSQGRLFEFLRANADVIEGESTGAAFTAAVASLRVTTDSDLTTEYAPNGMIKVAGVRGGTTLSQDLPGEVNILTPIYHGVTDEEGAARAYSIRVLFDVKAGGDGIAVKFSMPGLERVLVQANEDLVAHVQRELGGGFLVGAGIDAVEDVPADTDDVRVRAEDLSPTGTVALDE